MKGLCSLLPVGFMKGLRFACWLLYVNLHGDTHLRGTRAPFKGCYGRKGTGPRRPSNVSVEILKLVDSRFRHVERGVPTPDDMYTLYQISTSTCLQEGFVPFHRILLRLAAEGLVN